MWMSSLILSESSHITREELMKKLKEANVDSRPFFYPMSVFPMFETANTPVAARVSKGGINLPSGHNLTREQVMYACEVIRYHLGADSKSHKAAA